LEGEDKGKNFHPRIYKKFHTGIYMNIDCISGIYEPRTVAGDME
jgi:hypothetical protein